MNEQQLADIFAEQIDLLLAGEPVGQPPAIDGIPDLYGLAEQLSDVNFQPSPVAYAAFENQMATWFGSAGGGSPPKIWGVPKSLLMNLGFILAIGIGISIGITLLALGGTNADEFMPFDLDNEAIGPESTDLPASAPSSAPALPPPDPTEPVPSATPGQPSSLEESIPLSESSSLEETLPSTTPGDGDTIPSATPTPVPTGDEVTGDTPGSDNSEGNDPESDPANEGDEDRGHGNDPDGYDEDNPGNSSGLPDHSDQSGPGAGDFTRGGGNSGGGDNSGGGNNSGGGQGQENHDGNPGNSGGNNSGGQGKGKGQSKK